MVPIRVAALVFFGASLGGLIVGCVGSDPDLVGQPIDSGAPPSDGAVADAGPACSPGARECREDAPRTCGEDGTWKEASACTGTSPVCRDGLCVGNSCLGESTSCAGGRSCCSYEVLPTSTFEMGRSLDGSDAVTINAPSELPEHPATVQAFALDTYEVTVSRFRKFVESYPSSKPAANAGAHPRIASSGWKTAWNTELPASRADLEMALVCNTPNVAAQWSPTPSTREDAPINCVTWYEAFAFCAWDGGRLPLEVEWEYAAAGGSENRLYPWGSAAADASRAVFACGTPETTCGVTSIKKVGSAPAGAGRFGHLDLAGNVHEWVYDAFDASFYEQGACNSCAKRPDGVKHGIRGGAFTLSDPLYLRAAQRGSLDPKARRTDVGIRCARDR